MLRLLKLFLLVYNIKANRDVAQLGSALPWGGRGRAFKSRRSDQFRGRSSVG